MTLFILAEVSLLVFLLTKGVLDRVPADRALVESGGVESGGVESGGVATDSGDSDEAAAVSDGAESVQTVATERTPAPRRGRRSTVARADKPASTGVDAAAVRAWAAANGLTVSSRGRIKDEVSGPTATRATD